MIILRHAGLLSKAKGQVLRVSAALHVLFCDASDGDFDEVNGTRGNDEDNDVVDKGSEEDGKESCDGERNEVNSDSDNEEVENRDPRAIIISSPNI